MSLSFETIWNLAVPQVIEMCIEEVDEEFMKQRNLHVCDLKQLKQEIESFYCEEKELVKIKCYGDKKENNLDLHKIAAIFCAGLIKYKPVVFEDYIDEKTFSKMESPNQTQDFNGKDVKKRTTKTQFVINNYLVNYKIAFYVAADIVYHNLIYRAAEHETTEMLEEIVNMRNLAKYPSNPLHTPFENSFIIELARNDYEDGKFDYFLFALAMFQWQEYTQLKVKYCLATKN